MVKGFLPLMQQYGAVWAGEQGVCGCLVDMSTVPSC